MLTEKNSSEITKKEDLDFCYKIHITETTPKEFGWELDWLDVGTADRGGNIHISVALRNGGVTYRYPFGHKDIPGIVKAEALRICRLRDSV